MPINIPFMPFHPMPTNYKFYPLQFIQSTWHYCKVGEGTDAGILNPPGVNICLKSYCSFKIA